MAARARTHSRVGAPTVGARPPTTAPECSAVVARVWAPTKLVPLLLSPLCLLALLLWPRVVS